MPTRIPVLALLVLAACPLDALNIGDPTGDPSTTTDPTANPSTPTSGPGMTSMTGMTGMTSMTGMTDDLPSTSQASDATGPDHSTVADDTGVGTSTGGLDSQTNTGTTGPGGPECTPTGDALESAECLAIDPDRPFCAVDICVGCFALGPDACSDASAGARPICLPAGSCVQCDGLVQGQCSGDLPHCNLETHTCDGCLEHSECPQTACEVAENTCFPEEKLIYVRQGPTPCCKCSTKPGIGGTKDLPYCDFEIATLGVQQGGFSTGYTFHMLKNDEAAGVPGAVVLTGGDTPVAYAFTHDPGGPGDKHTVFSGPGPLINVPKNVTLYLKNWGVIIDKPQGDTSRGVDCQEGGSVWLDDSRVLSARGAGIRATGCDIHLRRSIVSLGQTEAIDMTGGSLHLENSFITQNYYMVGKRGGGLHLSDGATVVINYSTIADNSNEPSQMPGQFGDSIHCDGAASVAVRNSILVRDAASPNGGIACPGGQVSVQRSVVDTTIDGGDNVEFAAEDILGALTGAYRVASEAAGLEFFATVARWQPGDPPVDVDLDPRNAVPDGEDYAGADVFTP